MSGPITTKRFYAISNHDESVGIFPQEFVVKPCNDQDLFEFDSDQDLSEFREALRGAFELATDLNCILTDQEYNDVLIDVIDAGLDPSEQFPDNPQKVYKLILVGDEEIIKELEGKNFPGCLYFDSEDLANGFTSSLEMILKPEFTGRIKWEGQVIEIIDRPNLLKTIFDYFGKKQSPEL